MSVHITSFDMACSKYIFRKDPFSKELGVQESKQEVTKIVCGKSTKHRYSSFKYRKGCVVSKLVFGQLFTVFSNR